jgi:transcriptional regulator with XRE-family HTH domain
MQKENLRQIIGENIRAERLARDLSIEELANLLGLTTGFVGLIERGRRGATAFTLYKLSEIFKQPIDSIFRIQQNDEKESDFKELKRVKITSLISTFSEPELDFLISMIKNLNDLIHVISPSSQLDSDDD